jgi:site-specific recombinase XerD
MLEDMTLRKLSPQTQTAYIRGAINLTRFLGRSPDTATPEDLRRYQLRLVDHGTSPVMLNATITAVRFFFGVRLDRADALAEAAALLVLQKKNAQAIRGDGDDD